MNGDRARSFFIRNLLAGEPLERFLVSAVGAVLGVRFLLGLSAFPQLAAAACSATSDPGSGGPPPSWAALDSDCSSTS